MGGMTRFGAALLAASLSLVWPALGIGQVTVTGSGSVGVGQMTNSTINLGLTPKEAQALAKATAQEQTKILKAIVDRVINQSYNDKSKEQAELLALVQGFLSIVKGKQVPTDDWPQTFQELMRQFLTLGERLQAMPVTSDKIKQLVSEADAARRALQLEQADQLLAKAGNLAIEDAKTKQAQAKASTRQSASIMVSRATLAFTRLERIQGALLLEEAFDMRQLDPSSQTIWWLFEAGDAWLAQGRNDEALKRYVKARAAALAQTILDPKNAHWKRDLSISHDRIGYVQQALGEPDQALKSYLTSLEILRKLAAADSGSANRQRDLSIAHMRIGSLLENQGDLRKALKSYQAATANTVTVWLINWHQVHANDFAFAEEVTVKGADAKASAKRPDIVLYVNGIALGVLELKRSTVSVSEGIRQNLDNQKKEFIQPFFSTLQWVMAGNDTEGLRYGTIETPEKYYLQWVEEGGSFDAEANALDRHLLQVCGKTRLLELVHDFVVFDAGTKKLCRQNQYFGVKAAQAFIARREGGIIWHTQGSGKSLTMVWLAKWILANRTGARVLIITDRTELDEQIEKVFKGVSETICRTKSGADLIEKLNDTEETLLCTLVHKFGGKGGDDDDEGDAASKEATKAFVASLRNLPKDFQAKGDIHVFVDECHRTQSGDLHEAMKALLPNAVFIGFTGTPLLKDDKQKSIEVFGRYIHTYKFDQAVREGVVLDLRYEARDIDQSITSQKKIDDWFDAKTSGLNDLAKAQLKQKWGTMQRVLSSQSRLEQIVSDILLDMATKPRLMDGHGNAMLVAGTYLYIDKKMQDHGLFQAICRVNRLDGDSKEYGYVVDYKDLFKRLEGAVQDYTSGALDGYDAEDVKGLLEDRVDKACENLEDAREAVKALCEPVGPARDTVAYLSYFCAKESGNAEQLKENEPKRLKLYKFTASLLRAYAAIASELTEAGYGEKEIAIIKAEVDHYAKVRDEVKLSSGDYIDLKAYEPAMRHLIDTYIRADDSEKISSFDDLTLIQLIVERGPDAVDALPSGIQKSEEAVAETIENNVRKLIINESPVDPAYYDKMSKLLDALIEQRRKGAVSYMEYLQKVATLAQQCTVPGGDGPGYPSAIHTPALRALYNNLHSKLPDLAVAVDAAIKASLQAGWRDNSMKVKKVRLAIRHVLATAVPTDSRLGGDDVGAAIAAPLDLEKETDRILELAKQQQHDY